MKKSANRLALAAALLLTLFLMSGCIVVPVWLDHHARAPRLATIHVHVYDYYTFAPIPWAEAELYEESWWDWDYRGTWYVNSAGYTTLSGGYLYDDGDGGPESRDYGVEVYAAGYYPEWFEIGLDYWYPTETLSFYLVPWEDCGDCWTPLEGEPQDTSEMGWDLPDNRVKVSGPDEVEIDDGDLVE